MLNVMKILKWRHLTFAKQCSAFHLEYAFKISELFNRDQHISIHGDV